MSVEYGARRIALLISLFALVLAGMLVTSSIRPAESKANFWGSGSGCAAARFCVWTGNNYLGDKYVIEPCTRIMWNPPGTFWSAKNRCGVDSWILWSEGGYLNPKACIPPGGNRPTPGRINRVNIGDAPCP